MDFCFDFRCILYIRLPFLSFSLPSLFSIGSQSLARFIAFFFPVFVFCRQSFTWLVTFIVLFLAFTSSPLCFPFSFKDYLPMHCPPLRLVFDCVPCQPSVFFLVLPVFVLLQTIFYVVVLVQLGLGFCIPKRCCTWFFLSHSFFSIWFFPLLGVLVEDVSACALSLICRARVPALAISGWVFIFLQPHGLGSFSLSRPFDYYSPWVPCMIYAEDIVTGLVLCQLFFYCFLLISLFLPFFFP